MGAPVAADSVDEVRRPAPQDRHAVCDEHALLSFEDPLSVAISQANAAGCDGGKRVKGRKVHALVDTEGLHLRVIVHGLQDRDGAVLVLDHVR
jgi:hypothetical protein